MKRLALPLILLLVLSVLAYGTQIEVWLVGLTGEMAGILSDLAYETFTSQTGIEVNIYILTWADYYNRSLLALASRDTPDIFAVAEGRSSMRDIIPSKQRYARYLCSGQ
ncbi:MAG TPA: hypothetical protein PL057_02655 [Bacillota bacterium]|nr:hypothetical protein [Bacillota bacterium]HQD77705.1 hypothetical protein [Bacillota bacterium]